MRRFIFILLCTALCIGFMSILRDSRDETIEQSKGDYLIIEERFSPEGYYCLEYSNGRYYEHREGIRRKLDVKAKSVSSALKLPFIPTDKVYATPMDVDGIVEDIPFNYFSNLRTSSEFIYSLLNNGGVLKLYYATSRVIYIELEYKKNVCRFLIYKDYLKAYMPEGGC